MSITVEETAPFERHEMPDGSVLFYNDTSHGYWRDVRRDKAKGQWRGVGRLTGVSTITKVFDWAPDPLMAWAARLDRQGVATLAAEGLSLDDPDDMRATLGWLATGESISGALDDAHLSYTHARDDAAARGTNVHKHALHALASGSPIPALDELTPEERGYGAGVIAFWHEREPVPLHSEMVVADLELGVAGRLDLICELDGKTVLLDCKTVSKVPDPGTLQRPPYSSQHVQIGGYALLAESCGLATVDATATLQVFPNGDYRLVPGCAGPSDFRMALGVYRSAAAIQKAARETLKAAA